MNPWTLYVVVGFASAAVTFGVLTVVHAMNAVAAPPPHRARPGA